MANIPQSAGTTRGSPMNQSGRTNLDAHAQANEPDKTKEIQKKTIFPTTAAGPTPTKPHIEPSVRSADYYRYGKFAPGVASEYEVLPREFHPIEKDEVASIRVWGQRPDDQVPVDIIPPYSKFILEAVQESHTERSQIVETFGDFYVFMFGERPPVYNFSGQLINGRFTNWVTDFMFLYERYLRGTRCVENNSVIVMTYGNRQVEGLILNTGNTTTATNEGSVSFNFSMVVFERKYIHFSDDLGLSTADNTNLMQDDVFAQLLEQVAGPEGKEQSREEVSLAIQAAKGTLYAGEPSDNILPAGSSFAATA